MLIIKQCCGKRDTSLYDRAKELAFADTPKGASSSAAVYSLVGTAKANNLNVFAYLEYLLTYIPGSNWRQYPEELDDLMPWSPQVQAQCK